MQAIRAESVAERKFLLILIGAFGVLALVLAAVGVYGVMALVVSERTQEVGVRLALGASPSEVMAMIIRQAATLAGIGVSAGLVLAASLAPLMASQLFGVPPIDPSLSCWCRRCWVATATLAAIVPGRRAMRIEPVRAMNPQ